MKTDTDLVKILFATAPLEPPWRNASQRLAWTLAVQARGFRPNLLTAGASFDPNLGKAEAIYPDAGFGTWNKARLFLRIFKPDSNHLVHFFFQANPATVRLVRLAVGMRGHDPVLHTHCAAPTASCLFADLDVAVSRATQRKLAEETGRDIRLVRPAVPPFDPAEHEDAGTLRRRLGWRDDERIWLYPGDVEHSQAAHRLIETFPAEESGLKLALAYRQKTHETPENVRKLQELAETLDIKQRIDFIGEVEDLPALLHAADGVVFPVETLFAKMDIPLALLEAMAAGKPVIVGDLPSLTEAVEHETNGIVTPAGDAAAAWKAVRSLDDEACKKLGDTARETTLDRFHPERMARQYLELYRELAG